MGSLGIITVCLYSELFVSDGHCAYRNTRLLILRTLVQFYILPHTACSVCRVCTYVCIIHVFRGLLPAAPGFRNSWKTDPVALEPSKQPTEVSMLIQTVGFKLIKDSGLQIAKTLLEGGTSLYHLRFSTDK